MFDKETGFLSFESRARLARHHFVDIRINVPLAKSLSEACFLRVLCTMHDLDREISWRAGKFIVPGSRDGARRGWKPFGAGRSVDVLFSKETGQKSERAYIGGEGAL